jgi:hypothetical protein
MLGIAFQGLGDLGCFNAPHHLIVCDGWLEKSYLDFINCIIIVDI